MICLGKGWFSMIIMNVELDNLLLFHNFSINLSYPKKVVHSSIPNEYLSGRPSFRYKKLVILMGANATGKTALGKVLRGILNFISRKEAASIVPLIDNCQHPASFSIDLAFPEDYTLYRVSAHFKNRKNINDEYSMKHAWNGLQPQKQQKAASMDRLLNLFLTWAGTSNILLVQKAGSNPLIRPIRIYMLLFCSKSCRHWIPV